ncbi:DNA polymerase III subunit beta [Streptomyces sp. JV180]|uniref:DNA polymerase III subunit beta family protein n=1 Tax=Streptomyces sp. JV180 TaxID=858634 RepID=UPI00168A5899|nr:DNA polymerase III subunit beta [Streptomyces sp. JV180]MBD3549980.1 hypothetical protein [Streptomyces sp. JV180]
MSGISEIAHAHFTAPYGPLLEALTLAQYGTTTALSPAQECVLVEADTEGLTLRTYDWETAVSVEVPAATVTRTGASLLPLVQLKRALAAMVAGETKAAAARTTITLAGDLLITDHLTVPLDPHPVGEYTPAPMPAPIAATVDAADLHRQLQRVIPAACTDDTLPTLTGVQMVLTAQTLTLTGTDRYRVAVADLPATPHPDHPRTTSADPDPLTALPPARVMTRLSKHLKTLTGPVGIAYGTPGLTLTTDTATITVRDLTGTLPDLTKMFPDTVHSTLTLDRATTLRAIKKCKAMITAKGGTWHTPVTLRWDDDGRLTLAPRIGRPDEIARIKGVPIPTTTLAGTTPTTRDVHVTPRYLGDALDALAGADTITLHLRDQEEHRTALRPLLLTSGPCPTSREFAYLLMPVRVP